MASTLTKALERGTIPRKRSRDQIMLVDVVVSSLFYGLSYLVLVAVIPQQLRVHTAQAYLLYDVKEEMMFRNKSEELWLERIRWLSP